MEKKTRKLLNSLPGWLSMTEGLFLRKAALSVKNRQGAIVEIGSFQGKSTIWLAGSGQKVTAVDPHKGEVDDKKMPPTLHAFEKHLREFGVEKQVTLLQMTSMEAAAGWSGDIKLLFIDGLHDEENAAADFAKWSVFVGQGGIVAMHDAFCGWGGAERVAFRQIVMNDIFREVGVVGSIIYGVRGNGGWLSRVFRLRSRLCIRAALWLNRRWWMPPFLSFFLIHRVLKFFLLNRFTLKRS